MGIWVEGAWYRGRLLLVDTGRELLAVNEVALEAYLCSVVGSEMPAQWNLEALKAQAVAARSYALAHLEQPANSWYDLGNDQRHQVYGGIATESERTAIAVSETAGQVLVNSDNRAIVAYYAATDVITQRVHQGLGMSQQGAQALANQGWSYLKILERYYSGAAIARLE